MKYRTYSLAALSALVAGAGLAYAGTHGMINSDSVHHIFAEWTYFSDSGFSTPTDRYAKQDRETRQVIAEVNAENAKTPWAKHTFTQPEYLYFTDTGFSSSPSGHSYLAGTPTK